MKFGDWINRQRHNRGYGVQSPSAFFFVTQVLRERLPYYAYQALDKAVGGNRTDKNHFRELFRITNYLQPDNCISAGSATGACTMLLARPGAAHYAVAATGTTDEAKALLHTNRCHIVDSIEQFQALIEKIGTIGMLYVTANDNSDTLIRAALPFTNNDSVIVVDGINSSKATREWWQQLVNDSATIITYDMYSYGLLLFNKERIKQHYTLKR
jgi:hypothetical protein